MRFSAHLCNEILMSHCITVLESSQTSCCRAFPLLSFSTTALKSREIIQECFGGFVPVSGTVTVNPVCQLMKVYLSRELIYTDWEKHNLMGNYAGTLNYNFHHMCVRKVARTDSAHHCRGQQLSDAFFGVGVRAMDDLSTDSPLRPEQASLRQSTWSTLVSSTSFK